VPGDVVTAIPNYRPLGPKANENYIQALPVRRMRDALESWARHLDELSARVTDDSAPKTEREPSARPRGSRRPRSANA
jgi:hypothetical protein